MMTLVLVEMVVLACAGFVLAWLEWRTPQQTTQHRGLSELDMTADGWQATPVLFIAGRDSLADVA
jgi:hypothetical protein